MPHITSLTPNLVVASVERSLAFYRDLLGFTVTATVPEASPFVFAWMQHGDVSLFLNERETAAAEYPAFREQPIGGSLTLFLQVDDVDALAASIGTRAPVVMPLETKFYGMRECAITDPDGYILTLAQKVEGEGS